MHMTHLDDGTLLTFLDGELEDARRSALTSHLNGCGVCARRLRALEGQKSLLAAALPQLDVPPSTEAAREAVLARLNASGSAPGGSKGEQVAELAGRGEEARAEEMDAGSGQHGTAVGEVVAGLKPQRAASRRIGWVRPGLAKAASLVLLFAAAAAAAIPGSPVRAWLTEVVGPRAVVAPTPEPVTEPAVAEPSAPQEVGIQMDPGGGALTVSISGLPPGAEVAVRLVGGIRSWVYAAEGARFQTRPGAVEAEVPGQYVRVELARSLALASVHVDGVLYLRKTGDRLELAGPKQDSTDAEIRFEVP